VKLGEKITALQQIVSPFGKVQDCCRNFCLKMKSSLCLLLASLLVDDNSHRTFHFCQTDTSSVLFETIEYIKFLHEQIRVN